MDVVSRTKRCHHSPADADIIHKPDARVVAIIVDAHEEETATHDASGDLGTMYMNVGGVRFLLG